MPRWCTFYDADAFENDYTDAKPLYHAPGNWDHYFYENAFLENRNGILDGFRGYDENYCFEFGVRLTDDDIDQLEERCEDDLDDNLGDAIYSNEISKVSEEHITDSFVIARQIEFIASIPKLREMLETPGIVVHCETTIDSYAIPDEEDEDEDEDDED